MTWIFGLLARVGVSEPYRRPLAIAASVALLLTLLIGLKGCYDRDVIEKHEARINERVMKLATESQESADAAETTARNEVERTNDKARDAALGSDDPLRAGFGGLREGKSAGKPASH